MSSPIPSRIFMTADTVGGVWSYAMELVRELAGKDVRVLLATMGEPLSRDQRAQARSCSNLEIAESHFKLEWMPEPWADVEAAGKWLLDLAADFEPDVVHLNGYAHAALDWRAPTLAVGHSCVLSWWKAVKGGKAPAEYLQYERAVRKGLLAADAVVAPSHSMMQCLQEHYGEFQEPVVIPNGRNAGEYRSAGKEDFILSAGRLWDEAKNAGAVCACASKLPWPVRLAGGMEHPEGRATRLDQVQHLGRLDEAAMKEQFARAAIYVSPACYEPFGLSVLEAALSECALVLGDIPSLRENWDGAALFVSPQDASALERALFELISNSTLRNDLAKSAVERGRKFSSQMMGGKYLALYSRLMDRSVSRYTKERSMLVPA